MRLTSLHAENVLSFSSFDLSFQAGLNVIVGPNGAGKSNVARLAVLMLTALRNAAGDPSARVDVERYLRIGAADQEGRVELSVELDQPAEQNKITAFIRALVASIPGRSLEESPAVDSPYEKEIATQTEGAVTDSTVRDLFVGRLVLSLDAGPPPEFGLAYEFKYRDAIYHCGLGGAGLATGTVSRGPFVPSKRRQWSVERPDLAQFFSDSSSGKFDLSDLLPDRGQSTWRVERNHSSGRAYLMSEKLAHLMAVSPDLPHLTFARILHGVTEASIAVTENLRRPPRKTYELEELGKSVVLRDGGDLPLQLYRQRVGRTPDERERFSDIQTLFKSLTGHDLEIAAEVSAPTLDGAQVHADPNSPTGWNLPERHFTLHVEPVVPIGGGQIPVEFAGAGVWEALFASAFAVPVPGSVVILDEPAANMHPTWQRRLLAHLAKLGQTILVTHSPFLVPADQVDDIDRVTRFWSGPTGTTCSRMDGTGAKGQSKERIRQILAESPDARSALFASGVVLVEGDTELGVFSRWFSDESVVGDIRNSVNDSNVQLLNVASDTAFGSHVRFLEAFGIPWAIICDGPVLSPTSAHPLMGQFRGAGFDISGTPERGAAFSAWKSFWESKGVFTVAERFGVNGDPPKSGEIETFLKRIDPQLWARVQERFRRSKVRAGHAFASSVDLSHHSAELDQLHSLWDKITAHLRLDSRYGA